MLPDTAGRLAAKTSKISACSLYADTSSTLAPDSAGDQAMCLVCRGPGLEVLRVPSLEPLLTFTSASAGLPVMDSSEGGQQSLHPLQWGGPPGVGCTGARRSDIYQLLVILKGRSE